MNITEAIKWLENLRKDIGTCEHSSLWNYEKALVEIVQMLKKFYHIFLTFFMLIK